MIEVICEIGKNFVISKENESLGILTTRVYDLIEVAKKSGCDVVKFQVHNVEDEILLNSNLISPHFNQNRYNWVKRNTYPIEFWWEIKEYCRELDIEFLATPMSRGAAILLNEDLGIDRWKIGSGDILDFVMLDYIRDSGKPVILSSGMSSFEELKNSYEFLKEKTNDISILHCVSLYPCPIDKLNLNTILFFKKEFPEAKIGFSSHCLDIQSSLLAHKLGAKIIEQHFTLDRNMWGPDHKISLLPEEMKELVNRIKNKEKINLVKYHKALGIEIKYLQPEEQQFRSIFHKGIYASRDIKKGEIIEPDMLYAMRPKLVESRNSEEYPILLGQNAWKDFKQYESI